MIRFLVPGFFDAFVSGIFYVQDFKMHEHCFSGRPKKKRAVNKRKPSNILAVTLLVSEVDVL